MKYKDWLLSFLISLISGILAGYIVNCQLFETLANNETVTSAKEGINHCTSINIVENWTLGMSKNNKTWFALAVGLMVGTSVLFLAGFFEYLRHLIRKHWKSTPIQGISKRIERIPTPNGDHWITNLNQLVQHLVFCLILYLIAFGVIWIVS